MYIIPISLLVFVVAFALSAVGTFFAIKHRGPLVYVFILTPLMFSALFGGYVIVSVGVDAFVAMIIPVVAWGLGGMGMKKLMWMKFNSTNDKKPTP